MGCGHSPHWYYNGIWQEIKLDVKVNVLRLYLLPPRVYGHLKYNGVFENEKRKADKWIVNLD